MWKMTQVEIKIMMVNEASKALAISLIGIIFIALLLLLYVFLRRYFASL